MGKGERLIDTIGDLLASLDHMAKECEEEAEVYRTLAEILQAEARDPEFVARAVNDPAVVRIVSLIHDLYTAGEFDLAREIENFFALLAGAGRGDR